MKLPHGIVVPVEDGIKDLLEVLGCRDKSVDGTAWDAIRLYNHGDDVRWIYGSMKKYRDGFYVTVPHDCIVFDSVKQAMEYLNLSHLPSPIAT